MVCLLLLWGVQLALTAALLWPPAGWQTVAWWGAALATGGCALALLGQLPNAYRSLLWRRRKSPRPSLELRNERRRLAAALHDGVGSQLVYAMSLARTSQDPALLQMLEQCLLDLRLVVDSMDDDTELLPMCMARFRYRLQTVLERRAITLHWELGGADHTALAHAPWPQGRQARLVMAVLQEAVSNTLQHAHASEIWITLEPIAQPGAGGQLCVADNGVGLAAQGRWPADRPTGGAGCGAGLHNMQSRARELGGVLRIRPREGGGTCVVLRWAVCGMLVKERAGSA